MKISLIAEKKGFILFILLLILIYFPLFLHLTYMPIRIWDESILGINAYEMEHNHNYIVTYFNGQPEMSNCKPPLAIWCMVASSKLFGFGEISLRLPSAIAGLLLCTWLFYFIGKYSGSKVYSFLCVIVLITCQGYIRNHVTRTGEYDSILILFITIFSMHFFLAVETTDERKKWWSITWMFVFVTLAVLTKGIAPLMFGPGLLIYLLYRKKLMAFLRTSSFYMGLALLLVFGIGYYFLREQINPGYLHAVWINELGGRYATVNELHSANALAYLREIVNWQFTPYLAIFPVAIFINTLQKNARIKQLVNFSLIAAGVFLLVISFAKTKLSHYDAPIFPFLAIITSGFVFFIYKAIKDYLQVYEGTIKASVIAGFCTISILSIPYGLVLKSVYFPKGDVWEQDFAVSCSFFQKALNKEQRVEGYKLVFDNYNTYGEGNVLKCYEHALNDKGIMPVFINAQQAGSGDTIVVFQNWQKDVIAKSFNIVSNNYIEYCNAAVMVLGAKAQVKSL